MKRGKEMKKCEIEKLDKILGDIQKSKDDLNDLRDQFYNDHQKKMSQLSSSINELKSLIDDENINDLSNIDRLL